MRAPRPATRRAIYRGGPLCARFPVASRRACAYRWLRTPPRGPSHSSLHRCWPGPRSSPTSQRRALLLPWHRHWAGMWGRYRGRCRGRGVFPVKERRIGISFRPQALFRVARPCRSSFKAVAPPCSRVVLTFWDGYQQ